MHSLMRKLLFSTTLAICAACAGIMAAEATTAIDADLAKASKAAPDAKLKELNRILARYGDSKDSYVQGRVIKAKLDIAALTEDKEEKRRIYEECAESLLLLWDADPRNPYNLAVTLLDLAKLEDDAAGRAQYLVFFPDFPVTRMNEAVVAQALIMLAEDAPTDEEKLLGYDKVLALFSGSKKPQPTTRWAAAKSLNAKADLVSETAEKIALYDQTVELAGKSSSTFVQGQLVWALMHKADLVDDDEKIALYEQVVNSFENTEEEYIAFNVRRAFNLRLKLAGDNADKTRFYDQRLANLAESAPAKKIAELRYGRAGAAMEEAEKSERYDEVIAQYRNAADSEVAIWAVRAMGKKAALLDAYKEKKAAYNELVDTFGDSPDAKIRYRVADAMDDLARAADDPKERSRIYDAIFERYGKDDDKDVIAAVNRALKSKARITGDHSAVVVFQDYILSVSQDPLTLARALQTKAENTNATDEKEQYYDQIIQRFEDSRVKRVAGIVADAYLKKAESARDKTAIIAAYDAVIERYRRFPDLVDNRIAKRAFSGKAKETGDPTILLGYYDDIIAAAGKKGSVSRAMLNKANALENNAEKEALLGEITELFGKDGNDDAREDVAEAVLAKSALTDDMEQKNRLLDRIITDPGFHTRGNLLTLSRIFDEKVELTGDRNEKIRLLDQFIDICSKFNFDFVTINNMQKRAELLEGAEAKIAAYDEIIRKYGSAENPTLLYKIADIHLAKAGLVEDEEERLRIYDELLAAAGSRENPGRMSLMIDRILGEKEKHTGDTSVRAQYYDTKVRAASTDLEKAEQMLAKIRSSRFDHRTEQMRDAAEMVNRFLDSDDDKIQILVVNAMQATRLAAHGEDAQQYAKLYERVAEKFTGDEREEMRALVTQALLDKAKRTDGNAEKLRLYDQAIAKARVGDDGQMMSIVAEAMLEKAKAAEGAEETVRILDDLIQQYKNSTYIRIMPLVNEAIARKYRLQDPEAAPYDSSSWVTRYRP